MSFVALFSVFFTEFGVLGFFCRFCLDLRFNLFISVLIFELCIGLLRIVWFWLECLFFFRV